MTKAKKRQRPSKIVAKPYEPDTLVERVRSMLPAS